VKAQKKEGGINPRRLGDAKRQETALRP